MEKRKVLGFIDTPDLVELFKYKNRINALNDLKRTVLNPSAVVIETIKTISLEKIDEQLAEAKQSKDNVFDKIYNKYKWMQVVPLEEVTVLENGKAVQKKNDCSCLECNCKEK